MNVLFILGADDPEMRQIADILTSAGMAFGYAAVGAARCHPGNAYKADGVISPEGKLLKTYVDRVFVECEVAGVKPVMIIDHHRPGDPGFDLPPSKYWQASSIGQVISFLAKNSVKISTNRSWRRWIIAGLPPCRVNAREFRPAKCWHCVLRKLLRPIR